MIDDITFDSVIIVVELPTQVTGSIEDNIQYDGNLYTNLPEQNGGSGEIIYVG